MAVAMNYNHITTLGCPSRNPLPFEQTKELLLALVCQLDSSATLSKRAVRGWGVETTMAAYFLLTRMRPSTPLRWLKDEEGTFSVEHAVGMLVLAAQNLHATEDDLKAEVAFVTSHAWSGTAYIVVRAMQRGFNYTECLSLPSAGTPGNGGAPPPGALHADFWKEERAVVFQELWQRLAWERAVVFQELWHAQGDE